LLDGFGVLEEKIISFGRSRLSHVYAV